MCILHWIPMEGLGVPDRKRLHRTERPRVYREKALLVLCKALAMLFISVAAHAIYSIHLLKLFTGVDISTLPVSRSGREGNPTNSTSRSAAAAPKRAAFRRSITIVKFFSVVQQRPSLQVELVPRPRARSDSTCRIALAGKFRQELQPQTQ